MIRVSPYHQIELAEGLLPLLQRPPDRDHVVRRISQKTVNGQPLIQGELVIAGKDTLKEYPLAKEFPVHFRKSYYPISFHQNPGLEYENHLAISQIIPVPPPIGSTRTTFRSCFLPGVAYSRLSPFHAVEPVERCAQLAAEMNAAAAIGLWTMLVVIYEQLVTLHKNGFVHGDLYLHNVIVSRAPVGAHLIDFEQAGRREGADDAAWKERTRKDAREVLKEAVFLQCALGRQDHALAQAAINEVDALFPDGGYFSRAIERTTHAG